MMSKKLTLAALGLALATVLTLSPGEAEAQRLGLSQATARLATDAPATLTAEPELIAQHLRAQGLAVTAGTDNQGDPLLSTRSQGVKWHVYFYGCEGGRNCNAVTFESTYEPSAKMTLAHLNAWSLNKRYAYAVTRNDGVVALRMDVLMLGGVSAQHFEETHRLWETQLGAFLRHVEY